MNKEEILSTVKQRLETWHKMAGQLRALLILLGLISIVCSLLITVFVGDKWLTPKLTRVLSASTALALSILTVFGIAKKGNNSRNAWRHLDYALMRYHSGEISEGELAKAVKEGEDILGGVEFEYNLANKTK